jgi:V8-like Glu-specific endopeptidase
MWADYEIYTLCGPEKRFTNQIDLPCRRETCLLLISFPKAQAQATGFLVCKRLVLTAGHCVYDKKYGGWAKSIRVIPGANGSTNNVPMFGINAVSVAGWTIEKKEDYDYAGIQLPDNRVYEKAGGLIGLKAMEAGDLVNLPVWTLGYPIAMSPPYFQWNSLPVAQIPTVEALQFKHKCDTTAGNSGGPILLNSDTPIAVGIHTCDGCEQSGGIAGNWALRFTDFRIKKITTEWNPTK